ncbi:hypothetical protein GUJ93_ZPchr0006g40584 [Zizania palustris]|uniref:Uncharacterized protein n=1 Tax=Zizania palustris TaxID=103762 RepID=A0A8J5W4L1_ZIZPA|nr:hypothetical protein GUJ93_ZPchr0006g40584 [Zizania palustris]
MPADAITRTRQSAFDSTRRSYMFTVTLSPEPSPAQPRRSPPITCHIPPQPSLRISARKLPRSFPRALGYFSKLRPTFPNFPGAPKRRISAASVIHRLASPVGFHPHRKRPISVSNRRSPSTPGQGIETEDPQGVEFEDQEHPCEQEYEGVEGEDYVLEEEVEEEEIRED